MLDPTGPGASGTEPQPAQQAVRGHSGRARNDVNGSVNRTTRNFPDSVVVSRRGAVTLMHACLRAKLTALADQAGGSAQRVLRLVFLTEKLSIDAGELTDKGVLNQRNILRRHSALVDQLYAVAPGESVIRVIPGAGHK